MLQIRPITDLRNQRGRKRICSRRHVVGYERNAVCFTEVKLLDDLCIAKYKS